MTALDDLAPWPTTEQEATADALIKSLAVQAYARNVRIEWPGTEDKVKLAAYSHSIGILVNEYGVIALLRFLKEFHKDVADDAARDLWLDWQDGGVIPELLWDWLTEYKIDPDKVEEIAKAAEVEKPSAA